MPPDTPSLPSAQDVSGPRRTPAVARYLTLLLLGVVLGRLIRSQIDTLTVASTFLLGCYLGRLMGPWA